MNPQSWFRWLMNQQSSNNAEHQLDVFELESRLVLNADFSFTGGVLDLSGFADNVDVDDIGAAYTFDLDSGSWTDITAGGADSGITAAGSLLTVLKTAGSGGGETALADINLSSTLNVNVVDDIAAGDDNLSFTGNTINFETSGGSFTVATTGTQEYSGTVILDDGDTIFTGSTVTFNNALDANADGNSEDLTIAGNAVFGGIIGGGTDEFINITVSGNASIAANITIDGNLNIGGNVTLTGTAQLTAVDNGADPDSVGTAIGGTVTGGSNNLTIVGGGQFNGAVSGVGTFNADDVETGSSFAATSVTVTGTSDIGGDVTTTGAQSYTGAVTTDGAVEFSGSGLTFGSTITGNNDITLTGDTLALSGNISSAGNDITLQPLTNTTSIGIGAAATGTFNLDATELGLLQDGFSGITIGRADGQHAIDFNGFNFSDAITIRTPDGGSIDIGADLSSVAGGSTAAIVLDGSGATTTLNADIITAGASVTISDSLVVNGTRSIDTTNADAVAAGAIQITGAITGANADGTDTLTLDAAQGAVDGTGDANVTLSGNVNGGNGANDLESLAITGAAISAAGITVDGGITLEGTSVATGAVLSNSGNISYTGTSTLNGNVTATTGTIIFNSDILVGANIVVESTAGNALTFGTINSTTGNNFSLTANTAGITSFDGTVGATDALSALTTNAGGTTEISASISTTGNQVYGDAVEIQTSVNLTGALINFGSTVENEAGENNDLTITGNLQTAGAIGSVDAFNSLTVTGLATVVADITTINNQNFGTVIINQDTIFTSTNGSIVFGTIDSDAGNNRDLSIIAPNGTVTLGGNVGATDAINNLIVSSDVLLGGAITTVGSQDYSASTSIIIVDDTTLTSTGGSNFTFGTTIDSESGETNALTVNTTGTTTFNGVIGGTDRLSSLTTNAGGTTEIGANINTNGSTVTFNDAVILTANTVINEAGAGDIAFNSTLNSSAGNNFSLATNTVGAGVTVFGGIVGGVDTLSTINVTGGTTFGADITTFGSQLYNGGSTLTADIVLTSTNNNFISVNGTVDGTTIGQEALTIVTAGGIQLANGGNVGGNVRLESVTADTALSTTLVQSAVRTTGTQSYNNVDVANTILDGSSINIAGVVDQIGGSGNFTVIGDLTIVGIVGGVNDLTNIVTTGSTADFQAAVTASGNITITADTLSLGGNVTAPGDLILQPLNVATSIGIGAAATGTFNLDLATLGLLQDGFNSITIGRADGEHVIDFNGFNFSDAITIRTPNGGSIAIDGNLSSVAGGNTANIVLDGSGATTTLNADIITAGADVTISDSVLVNGVRIIDTTNADASAAGAIQIDGVISAINAGGLDALDLDAAQGAVDGVGDANITLNGNVDGSTNLVGGSTFEGNVITVQDVSLDGDFQFRSVSGSMGTIVAETNIQIGGAVTLNGNVTSNTSDISFANNPVGSSVTLGTNLTIDAATNLSLGVPLDGAFDLIVAVGGVADFSGTIGGVTPLNSLTVNATGTSLIDVNISTTGNQTYNNTVLIGSNVSLTAALVDFNSTVNSEATETNSLLVTGNLETSAAIGATDNLSTLTVTGDTSLGGNVTTTGQQTYGDNAAADSTTITADITLVATEVQFDSTVDSDTGNNRVLGITGNLDAFGEIGGTDALQSITVSGTSEIETDVTTVTTQNYTGGVEITGDVNFTGTTITFTDGVDESIIPTNDLTITGNLVTTNIGAGVGVRGILVTGTSQFSGTLALSEIGGQTYQGNVTTTGANFSFLDSGNGDINFDANLTGTNTAIRMLTSNGTINIGNDAVDTATGIASLDLDAQNIVLGNVTATGTSDIDLSNDGSLTQIATTAFISPNLLLTGDGTFTLTEATNNFNVLAANFTTSSGSGGDASDGNVPGGEVLANYEFNVFDADNLTIGTVGVTTGITTTQRDVRVEVGGNLFVNEVVSTSPGGSGDLFIDGATIAATPVVGNGDITLIGGSPDLFILANTTSATNMTLEADRDVIIQANVSTTAGANIIINADRNNASDLLPGDNQGGVRIDAGFTVVSDGDLTITGNKLFNDPDDVGPLGTNDVNAPGVVVHGATTVAGDMTVNADTVDITANISSTSGTSNLAFLPNTVNQTIELATASSFTTLNLTSTELDFIQDGFNSITFGRADGEHDITQGAYNYRDAITLNSPVAGTISIIGDMQTTAGAVDSTASVLIDGSGATTILGANIVTGGANVTISDSVLVNGGTRFIDTTAGDTVAAGNIQIDGDIAGANADGNDTLTLDAIFGPADGTGDGSVTLNGNVNGGDGANDLEQLTVQGFNVETALNGSLANQTWTVDGTVALRGALNLNTNLTISSTSVIGAIDFDGTIDGGFDLVADTTGITFFAGSVGGTTALASLTTNAGGTTFISDDITTTGNQTYNDAVQLFNTNLTAALVDFNSTVDSDFGNQSLTVTGNLETSAAIGANDALSSLTVTGNSSLGGNVTTTGFQTYNGTVTLTTNVITTSTGGGNITFNSTIDSESTELNSLTVNTSGITQFNGDIGVTDNLSALTTNLGGQTNINTGVINTNGATITFNDAVLLQQDVVITEAGTGNVTFNSTVDAADNAAGGTSDFGLTVNMTNGTPGTVSFNGAVGSDALGAQSDIDGLEFLIINGPVNLGANVTTTGIQDFNDAATINGNVTLNAGGNIDFASTIDGTTDGVDNLVLNTTATTILTGAIGATVRLASLTTNAGGTTRVGNNVTTTGNQTYNDAVILDNDTTLTGGTVSFASTLDSDTGNNRALTISGNLVTTGVVGGTDALASLTVTGTTSLGNNVTTTGEQNYNGEVTLTGDTILTGVDTDADTQAIDFGSTVDGAFALTVNGGGQFNGAVGSTTALTSLNVNGTSVIGGDVTTIGAQTFGGAAQLSANAIFSGTTTTFNSTLDSTPGNNFSATFFSSLVTNAAVGGTDALSSLFMLNTASLGGNVTTTGFQSYGGVTLTNSVVLTSTASGDIGSSSTIDGTTPGTESLTINTAGTTFIGNPGQNVGQSVALASITTDAPGTTVIFANSITTTGTQTYNDAFNIVNALVINVTTVTFASTVDASSLTVNGNLVSEGEIGGTVPLNFLTVSGTSSLHADVTTSGLQTYTGAVTLTSDVVLTSTGSGDISFGSTIDSSSGNLFSLTVNTAGITQFGDGVGSDDIGLTDNLSSLTTDAPGQTNIDAGTINTNGSTITFNDAVLLLSDTTINEAGTGNVTFNSTVDAADNTVASTSDVSLTINMLNGTPGNVVFNGIVGGDALGAQSDPDGLEFLTINGPTLINTSNITTVGNQTYNGTVELQTGTTLTTGGLVDFLSTVDSQAGENNPLTINGNLRTAAALGATTALGSLTANGTASLGGNVTTTGDQNYVGAVTLTSDVVMTSTAAGIILFLSTLDGTNDGGESLTLNTAGPSIIGFNGDATGSIVRLASITTDAPGIFTGIGGDVTTTGTQTYNDVVQTGNSPTLTGSTITFGQTVDLNFGPGDVAIVGDLVALGAIGGTNPLNSFSVSGTSSLEANVTTTQAQTYNGAVTLTNNVVTTSNAAGNITFGSTIDSEGGETNSLTANTTGVTAFNGVIGGTDRLSSLTTNVGGQTFVNAGTINTNGGGVFFGDQVLLQSNTTIDESGAGNVTFNNTVDSQNGNNFTLEVTTTTGTTFFNQNVGSDSLGAISQDDGLGAVTVNGLVSIGGNITTTGEQNFNGDATLTNSVTLTATDTDADMFDVEFQGTLTGNGNNLTIVNCAFFNGAVSNLGAFVADGITTGSSFEAASITLTGILCPIDFHGDVITSGDQNYAGTVTLSADVTFNAKSGGALGDIIFAPNTILNGNQFDLTLFADDILIGANSTFTFNDALPEVGEFMATACRSFLLDTGASITTQTGNITIDANQQTPATVGEFIGITLNNSTITSQGGNITMAGRGGDSATANANRGILAASATVSTNGTGTVSLTGTTRSTVSQGVVLDNTDITTVDGNLTVTGIGATNFGVDSVQILNGSTIQTTGNGQIDVTGEGDVTVNGPTTSIQTVTGNINLTADNGPNSASLNFENSSTVQSTSGDITGLADLDIIVNNSNLLNDSGSITLQAGSQISVFNSSNIQAGSGNIGLTSGDDTTIDGATTFVQTGSGDIAVSANGNGGSDIRMNNNSVVRSNSGNIDLTANLDVFLGLVNADFDANGTAGVIRVTADGNNSSVGFIRDNTPGETDADANLTGQNVLLQAGDGIGFGFDGPGDIDLRPSFGNTITVAAQNNSLDASISSTQDLNVGTVGGVNGITQFGNGDVFVRTAGSLAVDSGISNFGNGGVFANAQGVTNVESIEINSNIFSNQEIFISSGNDVTITNGAVIQSASGSPIQILAGAFEVNPLVFQQGNTDGNITMDDGTAIVNNSSQISLIAANNIWLSSVNAGANGNVLVAANRTISVAAPVNSLIQAGTNGSIFDNTVSENPNITAESVTFVAAQNIGQLNTQVVNGRTVIDPDNMPELDIDVEVSFLDSATVDQQGGQINISDPSDLFLATFGDAVVQANGGLVKIDAGGDFIAAQAIIDVSDPTGLFGQVDIDATGTLFLFNTIIDATAPGTMTQNLVQLYGGEAFILDTSAIDTRTNPTLQNDPAAILGALNNVEILVGEDSDPTSDPNSIDDVIFFNSVIITDFSTTDSVRPNFLFVVGFPVVTTAPVDGNIVFEGLFIGGLISSGTTNALVTVDWDDFSDLTTVLPQGAPSNNVGAAPVPSVATSLGVDVTIANPFVPQLFAVIDVVNPGLNPANVVRGFGGAGPQTFAPAFVTGLGFADPNVPFDPAPFTYRHLYSQQDLSAVPQTGPVGDVTGIQIPTDDFFSTFQTQAISRTAPNDSFLLGITASLNNSIVVARDIDGDRALTIDQRPGANNNFSFENEDPQNPNPNTSPDVLLSKQFQGTRVDPQGVFAPDIQDDVVDNDEVAVQEFEPFTETVVQLPAVTVDNGAAAAGSSSGQENRFELRIISPNPEAEDQFLTEIDLPGNIIEGDNRLKLFQGLTDNRYQLVFIKSDGTERVVIEVDVIQGDPITRFDNLEETINDVQLIEIDVNTIDVDASEESGPDTTQTPTQENNNALELIPVSQQEGDSNPDDLQVTPDPILIDQSVSKQQTLNETKIGLEFGSEQTDNVAGTQTAVAATVAGAAVLGKRNRRRARLNTENDAQGIVLDKRQRRRQRLFGELISQ